MYNLRFLLILFVVPLSTASAGQRVLGESLLAPGTPLQILDAADSGIVVSIQNWQQRLKSSQLPATKGMREQGITIIPVSLAEKPIAWCVTFALDDSSGGSRSIAILISRQSGAFKLENEWSLDTEALGELGYSRRTQSFSTEVGTLLRKTKLLTVEGIIDKQDCGCLVCQSRTMELREEETYAWNVETRSFQRTLYEKRYVAQPGEGVMAVARKALGDARLIAKLSRLNPELKPGSGLKEGQLILVERRTGAE